MLARTSLTSKQATARRYPHSYTQNQHREESIGRRRRKGKGTDQSPGFSCINFSIIFLHSSLFTLTISTPRCRNCFSPPTNVSFSPITTLEILYKRHAPVHMSHGERVVYIVAPLYAEAGSRPVFARQDISACSTALPFWTRMLWPLPKILPSAATRHAPMGMPPSAAPVRASERAARKPGSWDVIES